jgi:hypothetical protein
MSLLLGAPCARRAPARVGGALPAAFREVSTCRRPFTPLSPRFTSPSYSPLSFKTRQLSVTSWRRSSSQTLRERVVSRAQQILRRTSPASSSEAQIQPSESGEASGGSSPSPKPSTGRKQGEVKLSEIRRLVQLARPERKTIGIAAGLVSSFVQTCSDTLALTFNF